MKKPLYITSHGILSRKANTLEFINEDTKKQFLFMQLTRLTVLVRFL